ncbi:hypothetical protein H6P81_018998 [Aristolochia fimbriata]|uniref:Uncharacterized protein n=1 Tax=Aristolochia fimbriata TaxID=158543 RepID=A0AAV7E3Q9_ARIFI|nr:hypothetical protein H6P81_018998 [Aristolochia fimbriata]
MACSGDYNHIESSITLEEKLKALREWEGTPSSSSDNMNTTTTTLFSAFNDLSDLFECANSILHMPVVHGHDKWTDNLLDESLRLLELCSIARDFLLQMKEHLQDLQSALRRGRIGEYSGMENMFRDYVLTKKKMKKQLDKGLKGLKRADSKWASSSLLLLNKDSPFVAIVTVLREARSITVSIFESLLCFISGSGLKCSRRRKSLVAKYWVGTRRIACEEEIEKMSEAQRVDASLYAFYCQNFHEDLDPVLQPEYARRQLEGMDVSIQTLGDGLENLFRSLISTRVLLLNILNH